MKKLLFATILFSMPVAAMTVSGEAEERKRNKTTDVLSEATKQLFDAIQNNDIPAAEQTLIDGANINQTGFLGTPLENAMIKTNANLVEFLLKNGANANLQNPLFWTIHYLIVPDLRGSLRIAELLLTYGANPNIQSGPYKSTPLHIAARSANTDFAKILIEHGADITIQNIKGETPLELAQDWHNEDSAICKLLHDAEKKEDERKRFRSTIKGIPL